MPARLEGLSVLDVGCADGKFSLWAALRGADRVTGIERNRHNYERALFLKENLDLGNLELHWGGVESSCPDQRFDVVLCLGLIYHLRDPLGTLHKLRGRCKGKGRLFLASAIDLPEGDGSPLCRLDRYATGSHGMWSFNVPMVREMMTTSGFEIVHELVDDNPTGGWRYFASASAGDFSEHHIFQERIDQEFPINVERRRGIVRGVWKELGDGKTARVAVFGAGTHTPWMLEQVADMNGPAVCCVLDDRIPPGAKVAGLEVRRPTELDPSEVSVVVLSSWHQTEALRRRAEELFGSRVRIVAFDI